MRPADAIDARRCLAGKADAMWNGLHRPWLIDKVEQNKKTGCVTGKQSRLRPGWDRERFGNETAADGPDQPFYLRFDVLRRALNVTFSSPGSCRSHKCAGKPRNGRQQPSAQ